MKRLVEELDGKGKYSQRLIKLRKETKFQQEREQMAGKYILKVQANGTHDIFIGRQALVDRIGIIDHVTAEDEATTNSEDKIHGATKWEENADKSRHNQGNKGAKEERTHSREVVF